MLRCDELRGEPEHQRFAVDELATLARTWLQRARSSGDVEAPRVPMSALLSGDGAARVVMLLARHSFVVVTPDEQPQESLEVPVLHFGEGNGTSGALPYYSEQWYLLDHEASAVALQVAVEWNARMGMYGALRLELYDDDSLPPFLRTPCLPWEFHCSAL